MGSAVFVFGSFTEDEAKAFQECPVADSKAITDSNITSYNVNSYCILNSGHKLESSKVNSSTITFQANGEGKRTVSSKSIYDQETSLANGTSVVNEDSHVKQDEVSLVTELLTGSSLPEIENEEQHGETLVTGVNQNVLGTKIEQKVLLENGMVRHLEDSSLITSIRVDNGSNGMASNKGDSQAVSSRHLELHVIGDQKIYSVMDDIEKHANQDLPAKSKTSWAALDEPELNSTQNSVYFQGRKDNGRVGAKDARLPNSPDQNKKMQPRGLVNTGNSCFLNSTLQALLSCSPFWQLLQLLRGYKISQAEHPTLRALRDFASQFEEDETTVLKGDRERANKEVEVGLPFAPVMFDNVLQSFSPDQPPLVGKNRQHDAQEFLSFLMDRMHEELLHLEGMQANGAAAKQSTITDEEDEWETVGPKNRTSFTRTYSVAESSLSEIFGGKICSVVKTKGNKASATVQPFLLLHLDIFPDAVHSVEDALKLFAAPESLENYKPISGKTQVSASKSVKIQALPKVLVLHLMRFSYGSTGSNKLHKPIRYPVDLTLGRELLFLASGTGFEARRYELVATISHHGKDSSSGHYTADARQSDGRWLRFDDRLVSLVNINRVLHDQAYILFYRRLL